jgi:hypothetical protein
VLAILIALGVFAHVDRRFWLNPTSLFACDGEALKIKELTHP